MKKQGSAIIVVFIFVILILLSRKAKAAIKEPGLLGIEMIKANGLPPRFR